MGDRKLHASLLDSHGIRRISCKRCQHRKIRCSRTDPCENCTLVNVKCEYRDNDYKRPPVSREYASALESRVATLETILTKLRDAPNNERDAILGEVVFGDHLQFNAPLKTQEDDISQAVAKASLQETTEGSMIYHGPTSIFTEGTKSESSPSPPSFSADNLYLSYDDPRNYHNPTVRLCIGLFFYWQYAECMFINREAFVQAFQENPIDGEFCSAPLVYAMCALGALMSSDPNIRGLSTNFIDSAEGEMMKQGLAHPSITSVQTWLCCAYYEVGRGNLSKGWLFSGIAFRMGQDLGFQREPTLLERSTKKSEGIYVFDDEWRRRMYWGCFLADKMFSLFLGRPTFMHENDADVDMSIVLPHYPLIWEDWLGAHNMEDLQTINAGSPILALVFNRQVELSRIIHDMLSNVFAPKRKGDKKPRWTTAILQQLNARLLSWHDALPSEMRWKRWVTSKERVHPNVAVLHTMYHTTRICLNLPFLRSLKPETLKGGKAGAMSNSMAESIKICNASTEAIVTILERFKAQHTLGNTPLILAQGAIVAANSVLVTSRLLDNLGSLIEDTPFLILNQALAEMSASWSLAGDASLRFRKLLGLQSDDEDLGGSPEQPSTAAASSTAEPSLLTKSTTDTITAAANTAVPAPSAPTGITVDAQAVSQTVADSVEAIPWLQAAMTDMSEMISFDGTAPSVAFESPEQYSWEPLGFLDTGLTDFHNSGTDLDFS